MPESTTHIFLTGASSGIGASIYADLSEKLPNIDLTVFSRKKINLNLSNHILVKSDLGKDNFELPKRLLSEGIKNVIFIDNAGTIDPICKGVDLDEKSLIYSLNVNFFSPFKIAQKLLNECIPLNIPMLIIQITSGAAHRPIAGWLSYCVGKASKKMSFDILAEENSLLHVEYYDPGIIDTNMQAKIRIQSDDVMPDVKLFQDHFYNGRLKTTKQASNDILNLIDNYLQKIVVQK